MDKMEEARRTVEWMQREGGGERERERVGGCLRWRLLAEDVWGADGISTGSAGVAGQAQWQTRQAGADDTAAREHGSTNDYRHGAPIRGCQQLHDPATNQDSLQAKGLDVNISIYPAIRSSRSEYRARARSILVGDRN